MRSVSFMGFFLRLRNMNRGIIMNVCPTNIDSKESEREFVSEKGELLNRNGTDPTISANKMEMMTIQKAVFTVRV